MTVKLTSRQQQQQIVDQASQRFVKFIEPRVGWLRTIRKALGISGAELARKLGVTRALISQAERNEPLGSITLKSMETMAAAMGCKIVYAIIPTDDRSTSDLIYAQAEKKARAIAARTHEHMVLENQSLFKADLDRQIRNLAERLVVQMPADFWSDK